MNHGTQRPDFEPTASSAPLNPPDPSTIRTPPTERLRSDFSALGAELLSDPEVLSFPEGVDLGVVEVEEVLVLV